MLIQHKKGNVKLPTYGLFFPKDEAVEVKNEKLAERILRNPSFFEVKGDKRRKSK